MWFIFPGTTIRTCVIWRTVSMSGNDESANQTPVLCDMSRLIYLRFKESWCLSLDVVFFLWLLGLVYSKMFQKKTDIVCCEIWMEQTATPVFFSTVQTMMILETHCSMNSIIKTWYIKWLDKQRTTKQTCCQFNFCQGCHFCPKGKEEVKLVPLVDTYIIYYIHKYVYISPSVPSLWKDPVWALTLDYINLCWQTKSLNI